MLTLCMCTAVLMGCSALYSDIIAHMMLKDRIDPFDFPHKTEVRSRSLWPGQPLFGYDIRFIAHMMQRYVYSGLSHIMLWVAGGNCASKMCNRIRGERYRRTRLVTLP